MKIKQILKDSQLISRDDLDNKRDILLISILEGIMLGSLQIRYLAIVDVTNQTVQIISKWLGGGESIGSFSYREILKLDVRNIRLLINKVFIDSIRKNERSCSSCSLGRE